MNQSVQNWLDKFASEPENEIHKLIMNYAGVVAWAKSSLNQCFREIYEEKHDELDSALVNWLEKNILGDIPENTSPLVWASTLENLFSALKGIHLPRVVVLMLSRGEDWISWLKPMKVDNVVDPLASYKSTSKWYINYFFSLAELEDK